MLVFQVVGTYNDQWNLTVFSSHLSAHYCLSISGYLFLQFVFFPNCIICVLWKIVDNPNCYQSHTVYLLFAINLCTVTPPVLTQSLLCWLWSSAGVPIARSSDPALGKSKEREQERELWNSEKKFKVKFYMTQSKLLSC